MATILVVDDEPDLRHMLRRVFERAGHQVVEAANGAAAMRCISEEAPNLVVTDVMMPVMDGAELIRLLRDDPSTAHLPIVAVSGDLHLAHGADAVLSKPYIWKELIAVSDRLLGNGQHPA
jgi:CheY-like chemotaxis protein